jgi:hypothetical protein
MKKVLVCLLISAIASIGMRVEAETIVGKDVNGNLYIGGLTANSDVQLKFLSVRLSRTGVANSCGLIIIRNSTSAPIRNTVLFNGIELSKNDFPAGIAPTCRGSQVINPNLTQLFNINLNGDFIISNASPGATYSYSYESMRTRRVRVNACGFARVSNNGSSAIRGIVEINGTQFDIDAITRTDIPICVGGNTYVKANQTFYAPYFDVNPAAPVQEYNQGLD